MQSSLEIIARLDEKQKLAFMRAFVYLARADGAFDEDEKLFIADLSKLYGLKKKSLPEIMKPRTDKEIVKEVKVIKDKRAKLELIKEMCMLAHIDSNFSEIEIRLIGSVGKAMGVKLEKIEQISNWIIDRIIWLEEEKLIFEK